jgi:hypothetical protein
MADCWRSVPRIDKTIIQQNVLFATSETYFFSTLLAAPALRTAGTKVRVSATRDGASPRDHRLTEESFSLLPDFLAFPPKLRVPNQPTQP